MCAGAVRAKGARSRFAASIGPGLACGAWAGVAYDVVGTKKFSVQMKYNQPAQRYRDLRSSWVHGVSRNNRSNHEVCRLNHISAPGQPIHGCTKKGTRNGQTNDDERHDDNRPDCGLGDDDWVGARTYPMRASVRTSGSLRVSGDRVPGAAPLWMSAPGLMQRESGCPPCWEAAANSIVRKSVGRPWPVAASCRSDSGRETTLRQQAPH